MGQMADSVLAALDSRLNIFETSQFRLWIVIRKMVLSSFSLTARFVRCHLARALTYLYELFYWRCWFYQTDLRNIWLICTHLLIQCGWLLLLSHHQVWVSLDKNMVKHCVSYSSLQHYQHEQNLLNVLKWTQTNASTSRDASPHQIYDHRNKTALTVWVHLQQWIIWLQQ